MAQTPESSSDRPPIPPSTHHTTHIYEAHSIGADKRPVSHTIVQEILALEPLRIVPSYFDTDEVSHFTFEHGCTLGEQEPVAGTNLHLVELVLDRTLDAGERARLEYTTWFNYAALAPPEYRRRVGANAMSALDITVQFVKGYEPRNVCAAQWPNAEPDSPPLLETVVAAEPRDSITVPGATQVRRQETDVPPNIVLGFLWAW